MPLYREMTPDELNGATVLTDANKSEPANKSRGRPIVSSGDPKRDARNKRQRELMQRRRAAK